MRRPTRPFLIAPLLTLALVACPRQENKLQVTQETNIPPSGVGPTRFGFKLEHAGEPVLGAEVEVENNMTHPGMVPTVRKAQEIGGGRYEAQNLEFQMAGDYVVTVTAKKDGKTMTGETRFSVKP